ncbi:hypothetical protein [Streptomyces sp. NPDC007991]|uniref:hypothetical protein n=1 Tax=Streptomyces sp. NPDC007991 TaxID=3364803 RepID=UPI0036EE8F6A
MIANKIAAHGDIKKRGIPGVDDLDVPEYLEDMMTGSQCLRTAAPRSASSLRVVGRRHWDDADPAVTARRVLGRAGE